MSRKLGSTPVVTSRIPPLLMVISGPSGVGKDAVLNCLRQRCRSMHYTVTLTTRPRRKKECDGKEYHFTTPAEFKSMIERNELLEWANVYGHLYGVPKDQVKQALNRGLDVVIKTDVQGAATLKKILPEAVLVFIAPPSMEKLDLRLRRRKTESYTDMELRTKTAQEEMKYLPIFDYLVINEDDELERTVADIKAIVTAEKCRVKPRAICLK